MEKKSFVEKHDKRWRKIFLKYVFAQKLICLNSVLEEINRLKIFILMLHASKDSTDCTSNSSIIYQ